MTAFVVSQALVAVVFVVTIITFQFRRREPALACCVAVTFLLGIHFWLLDANTAALLAFVASVRYFIAIYRRSRRLVYIFLSLVLVSTAVTYSGPLSLLAGSGSVLTTIASFRGNQGFRETGMLASIVWIVHDVIAGSPGAAALEVFFLGSNVVGYYRYFWRKPVEVAG